MRDSDLQEIRAAITRMLPESVVASVGAIASASASLTPAESTSAARMSPGRLQEFTAGRGHAKSALEQLGLHSPEVAVRPDRAPLWPRGYVGSISHSGDLVLAVAARSTALRAIGVDLEPAVPLDSELLQRVCRPEELARLAMSGEPSLRAKLIFSAKESVYKCIAPHTRSFLEFDEVEILFETGEQRFVARGHGRAGALLAPSTLAGAFIQAGGYWVTAAWQTAPARQGQE